MLNPVSDYQSSRPSGGQLAFLRRVSRDDSFRADLEADPQAALAEYGLHVDPATIPARVALPDENAILDVLGGEESEGPLLEWAGWLGA